MHVIVVLNLNITFILCLSSNNNRSFKHIPTLVYRFFCFYIDFINITRTLLYLVRVFLFNELTTCLLSFFIIISNTYLRFVVLSLLWFHKHFHYKFTVMSVIPSHCPLMFPSHPLPSTFLSQARVSPCNSNTYSKLLFCQLETKTFKFRVNIFIRPQRHFQNKFTFHH